MAFEFKRFWQTASAAKTEDGFSVFLDTHPLKTPLKNRVIVPTMDFAVAIADEWQAIDRKIHKHLMPFTRISEAAIDGAASEYAAIVDNLTGYGASDLLCYRAETPVELISRQAESWDPLLDWAAHKLAAPLNVTSGIVAIDQPGSSLETLKKQVESFDLFQLTAFYDLVKISGSLVLALAVAQGHVSAEQAWALSRVDENWQIDQWGTDDEAEALAQSKLRDFVQAATALKMLTIA